MQNFDYPAKVGLFIALVAGAFGVTAGAADGVVEPYHADSIKPFQAAPIKPAPENTIEPYHAQPIKPETGKVIEAEKKTGSSAGEAKTLPPPNSAGVIQPFQAKPMKPTKPAGIDPAPVQGPLDQHLIGRWEIQIPGVAYQSETDRGAYIERQVHIGPGGWMGLLTINAKGEYRWTKNGHVARGKLQQVVPRNFGDPKATYWKIEHVKEVYYIASGHDDELTLYSPGTNLFAAAGKRRKS